MDGGGVDDDDCDIERPGTLLVVMLIYLRSLQLAKAKLLLILSSQTHCKLHYYSVASVLIYKYLHNIVSVGYASRN